MSTADGWDLTVPEDEAELLAELRRHGVVAGKRYRLVETPEVDTDHGHGNDGSPAEAPRRNLRFAGMISAEPDLSENFDHYLAQSYGQD
jgi:hypothetical protein